MRSYLHLVDATRRAPGPDREEIGADHKRTSNMIHSALKCCLWSWSAIFFIGFCIWLVFA